jgi:hypothetical protein
LTGGPTPQAAAFAPRLDAVEMRLRRLAAIAPAPAGLTDPDEPSGERWEWGQVWAHLVEFVPYWCRQIRTVLATLASAAPPPFGRVKTDATRVAAIEADRHRPPQELFAALAGQLPELRALLDAMSAQDWARTVAHSTLGTLDMPAVFEMFLVGHLESHADQLDGLVAADARA